MDMKTLRTGQELFVSTANHWTKLIQPMYSVFTRETVGGMSKEISLRRFRSIHFRPASLSSSSARESPSAVRASSSLLSRCSARVSFASASLITHR